MLVAVRAPLTEEEVQAHCAALQAATHKDSYWGEMTPAWGSYWDIVKGNRMWVPPA